MNMSQNAAHEEAIKMLEANGIQKEELLFGAQATALALAGYPLFAEAVLPDELNIIRAKGDTLPATKRFAKELGLTVAVFHAASAYALAQMEGREYDKSVVLKNYEHFNTLDAEGQREMVVETLRMTDDAVTKLCLTVATEEAAAKLKSVEDAFDKTVAETSGMHINVLLECFPKVIGLLGGIINIHAKVAKDGASFLDATHIHQRMGIILSMQVHETSFRILPHMMDAYLKDNLSEEQYPIISAILEKAAAEVH